MKNNQPVTQREVSFPPNAYLVSRTDLKGMITYANEAFVEISGFSRDELLGSNHNLVRHPDMPEAAFRDLWTTVKAGLPWRGIVKNRCKSGDFYWVKPLSSRSRRMAGSPVTFQSVPRQPGRNELPPKWLTPRLARKAAGQILASVHSLRTKLWAAVSVILALMVLVGVMGIRGIAESNDQLYQMYKEKLTPSNTANRMMVLLADSRAQMMLGMQHDPSNPNSKLHDHPMEVHIDATLKNREAINLLLEDLKKVTLSEKSNN